MEPSLKNIITPMLSVKEEGGRDKYLGFPSVVGKNKKVVFNFIKDKMG